MNRYIPICEKVAERLNATADREVYHVLSPTTAFVLHERGAVLLPHRDLDTAVDVFQYKLLVVTSEGKREFDLGPGFEFDATQVHEFVMSGVAQ